MIVHYRALLTLTLILLSPLSLPADPTDDETCLLQVGSQVIESRETGGAKFRRVTRHSQHQACNDSVPVRGSKKAMPARGFITCCNLEIPKKTMVKSLESYLSSGGRLIDTAPDYGYEHEVGAVVRNSKIPREDIWLSSKVDTDGWRAFMGSPKEWALKQVDKTLTNMKTPYLDTMSLHFGPSQVALQAPQPGAKDATKMHTIGPKEHADMWRGLIEAKKKGKVRNIGVVETTRKEIENLMDETGEAPAIVMTWHHPWTPQPQKDYVSWAKSKGMTVVAYGLFNFKKPAFGNATLAIMSVAERAAKRHDTTPGQLAIKWALDQGLAFVTGMYHPEYLKEDLACQDFQTDKHDHEALTSAPAWPCELTLFTAMQQLPGCAP